MKTKEETITIPKRIYENLLANKKELELLYEHDVQLWENYENVIKIIDNNLTDK